MGLTRIEQHLIRGLKVFEVSKGIAAAIYMTLQGENQQLLMIDYMVSHKNATGKDLLEQARIIAKMA